MKPATIALLAVCLNFFGREFAYVIGVLIGVPVEKLMPDNAWRAQSLVTMGIVFAVIAAAFTWARLFSRDQQSLCDVVLILNRRREDLGSCLLLVAALGLVLPIVLSADLEFDVVGRGVGQFERDIGGAWIRLSLLALPIVAFMLFAYRLSRLSVVILALASVAVVVADISNGNRRLVMYAGVVALSLLALRLSWQRVSGSRHNWLPAIVAFIVGFLLGTAYLLRVLVGGDGIFGFGHFVYLLLLGTVGGLGTSAILWHTQQIMSQWTGLLYGKTFLAYTWSLLVPSVFLYALGFDEFLARSAYLFDGYYNSNPNMGYDFMMLADFVWNFGDAGFALYAAIAAGTIVLIDRFWKSPSAAYRAVAVVLCVYWSAGQRSDFGFFLKGAAYGIVTIAAVVVVVRSLGRASLLGSIGSRQSAGR